MKATIHGTNEVVQGRTLKEIKRKMDRMLDVSGPRGLTATVETGAVIHTELYDGQDYIRSADGKKIL